MARIDFFPALRQLGEAVGLEDLALGPDSSCTLAFDDLILSLNWDEEGQRLLVHATVGWVDEKADNRALYEELLAADCLGSGTGGLTLGLDASAFRLLLSGRMEGRDSTPARLLTYMTFFVNMADSWRKRIRDFQEGREPAASRPELAFFDGIRA